MFEAATYMHIWKDSFGEVLICEKQLYNASDRYTVAVIGKSISDIEIPYFF